MSLVVRDGQPGDGEEVARIQIVTWQAAYRDILPADYLSTLPAGLERRAQWWSERAASADPRACTLVAEDQGEVMGFADIGPSRDPGADQLRVGELNAIYVLPSAWGRGVGQALMAETPRPPACGCVRWRNPVGARAEPSSQALLRGGRLGA